MTRPLVIGLANAIAILVLAAWGVASDQWYFEAQGSSLDAYQVLTFCLVAVTAPAFLISMLAVLPFHLGLLQHYIFLRVFWAIATVPIWLVYERVLRSSGRTYRILLLSLAVLSLYAAIWAAKLTWAEGHDDVHSSWSGLTLVSMFLGIAFFAARLALHRKCSTGKAA